MKIVILENDTLLLQIKQRNQELIWIDSIYYMCESTFHFSFYKTKITSSHTIHRASIVVNQFLIAKDQSIGGLVECSGYHYLERKYILVIEVNIVTFSIQFLKVNCQDLYLNTFGRYKCQERMCDIPKIRDSFHDFRNHYSLLFGLQICVDLSAVMPDLINRI